MKEEAMGLALELISTSSSQDFHSPLEWGQWCRDVARLGMDGDLEELKYHETLYPAE